MRITPEESHSMTCVDYPHAYLALSGVLGSWSILARRFPSFSHFDTSLAPSHAAIRCPRKLWAAGRLEREVGTPVSMVRGYAMWGGIPRYWDLVGPFGDDLDGSVDALAMDPMKSDVSGQPPAKAFQLHSPTTTF